MRTAFPKRKPALLPLEMQELLEMTDEERAAKEQHDREMKEYVGF